MDSNNEHLYEKRAVVMYNHETDEPIEEYESLNKAAARNGLQVNSVSYSCKTIGLTKKKPKSGTINKKLKIKVYFKYK
jgi:hypothetical protein